MPTTLLKK